jgi:hypothetical protein
VALREVREVFHRDPVWQSGPPLYRADADKPERNPQELRD